MLDHLLLAQAVPGSLADPTTTNVMLGAAVVVYALDKIIPRVTSAFGKPSGEKNGGNGGFRPGTGPECIAHTTAIATLTEALRCVRVELTEIKVVMREDFGEMRDDFGELKNMLREPGTMNRHKS